MAAPTGGARIVTGPEPAVIDEDLCRCCLPFTVFR